MKNGNTTHTVSSLLDVDTLDLWPGDKVEVRGARYKYTADGKLVAC
jgi:hypothetical protein